jgi:uncharacterized membrane protein
MNGQCLAGFVLLAFGGILLMIGLNASSSLADQVSHTFTGRFTQATTWYIIGGIVSALGGLVLMVAGVRKHA